MSQQGRTGGIAPPQVFDERAPVFIQAYPASVLFALALALHLWTNAGYGIFRDELYYIVCGWHLAWGYMDQPPLTPAIAALSHAIFGLWLPGFRLAPALAFAATVALTVNLARLLGGGLFAAWLAGLAVFCAGILQVMGVLLVTDLLQPAAWTACTYALVRAVRDGDRRWWLALGAIGGVAFLGKYNVALYLGTCGLALLASPQRRALATWQPWAGAAIMLAIAAPNLAWQTVHSWPFLAHIRDLTANHTIRMSWLAFAGEQVIQMNPSTLPVWGAGLAGLLFLPKLRPVRWIGIAAALLVAFGAATHAKPYYLAPLYPGLLAAGGVALETWLPRRAARAALTTFMLAGGLALAPLCLPLLPPSTLAATLRNLGFVPSTGEKTDEAALPQYFADMFGWQGMADAVFRAWRALPPDDQARAVFIARNYGEAAAIEILGHGPPSLSLHQSYWFWGPRGHDGSRVLHVGDSRQHLLTLFAQVDEVGRTPDGWGMPYEVNQPIWLCRDMRVDLVTYWRDHLKDN